MGLPFVNVLIAIPTGIVIGKLIIRTEKGTLQSMYTSGARASLLAGILAALAVVIPLIAIAIAAPKGATIGQEISQLADPDLVPYPWNAIPVAMMLGAMLSTVVIMSLNIVGCFLAIKWHEKRHAKESGSVVSK
jgi:protein-S-isoprenylcysteine O-methyltransferase Ste14